MTDVAFWVTNLIKKKRDPPSLTASKRSFSSFGTKLFRRKSTHTNKKLIEPQRILRNRADSYHCTSMSKDPKDIKEGKKGALPDFIRSWLEKTLNKFLKGFSLKDLKVFNHNPRGEPVLNRGY